MGIARRGSPCAPLFLGVLPDLVQAVHVASDGEVEAPVVIDPRLPEVARHAVFLGAEGWVVEAFKSERRLFVEGALCLLRRFVVRPQKVRACGRSSFPGVFTFPGVELGALSVKVRQERLSRVERAGVLSLPVFLLTPGDAAIDGSTLGRRMFIGGGRFRHDADDSAGNAELDLVATLKPSLLPDTVWHRKRGFVY